MSLLADVVAVLDTRSISYALIGAAAMAVHGVSRATADVDLLTVDTRVLSPDAWRDVERVGTTIRILRGDLDDPLAGTVRLARAGARTVDVVVGRFAWQLEILNRADARSVGSLSLKVVTASGLVLLKLHAGSAKDAWDVRSLLESHPAAATIRSDVDQQVARLPQEARDLWARIRDER